MKSTQVEHHSSPPVDESGRRSVDSLPRSGSPLRNTPQRNGVARGRSSERPYLVPVPEPPSVGDEDTEVRDQQAAAREAPSTNRSTGTRFLDRILVRKARRMVIVRTEDVLLIQASGNYVEIVTEKASHLLRSPITELDEQLDPERFLRIHRSTIINTDHLEAVETNPAGDYFLRITGDHRVKCSRSYRGALRRFLSRLSTA